MGKLTRLQIKDYLQSITGEMDAKRINDTTLNEDINLAQRKIQMDTLEIGGIKQYTKQLYSEGYICATPTDMLFHPNAIIDIEASANNKASKNCLTLNNTIIIEARESGTALNGWVFTFTSGAGYETSPVFSSISVSSKTATILFTNGVTEAGNIEALFANNLIMNSLFIAYQSNESDQKIITLLDSATTQAFTTAGGTGSGMLSAEEKSIELFNRAKRNTFQAGSSSHIIYRRLGDDGGAQTIEFNPNTVKYSKIYYHYLLPDLTSDGDYSGLPIELEELLLIECQRRIYIYLKQQNNSAEQNADYVQKLQNIDKKYQDGLFMATQDKKRTGSVEE